MNGQGRDTAQWEMLERWALECILRIVETRDGHMAGPSVLDVRDFVGRQLRVRYEVPLMELGGQLSSELGTLVATVTSIHAVNRQEAVRGQIAGIIFGIVPCTMWLAGAGTLMVRAVAYRPSSNGAVSITNVRMLSDSGAHISAFHPASIHILWD